MWKVKGDGWNGRLLTAVSDSTPAVGLSILISEIGQSEKPLRRTVLPSDNQSPATIAHVLINLPLTSDSPRSVLLGQPVRNVEVIANFSEAG